MSIQPAQPQSIGGVLDTTFQLYKAAIVKLIPLSLIMALASSPPTIYMLTNGSNLGDPLAVLGMMRSPGYWLSILASWIGTLWLMSAAYLKMGAIGTGSDLGLGSALQQALSRLPTILLMTLLFGIALLLGLVLLLVPGLILMVSFALCFNTALFDGKGPIAALTESHRLVWGNWWRTLAILTVGFIIVFVIYMAVSLVIGAVAPLLVLGGGDVESVLLFTLITSLLIGLLASLVITPFYLAMLVTIYWDLKLRKDGGDLAARVGALNPA